MSGDLKSAALARLDAYKESAAAGGKNAFERGDDVGFLAYKDAYGPAGYQTLVAASGRASQLASGRGLGGFIPPCETDRSAQPAVALVKEKEHNDRTCVLRRRTRAPTCII